MSRFKQYDDTPEVSTLYSDPVLYFTPESLAKMRVYIEECSKEIGWFGAVKQISYNEYLCNEVYLLHQDVGDATTEIQPADLIKFAEEEGEEVCANIKLWGHSHVNMSVSPSGQDDKQVDLFRYNGLSVFFRIICNKQGDMDVTFYDFGYGYLIEHLPWDIYTPVDIDTEKIKTEIKLKVKEKPVHTYYKAGKSKGKSTPLGYAKYWDDDDDGYTSYDYYSKWEPIKAEPSETPVAEDDGVFDEELNDAYEYLLNCLDAELLLPSDLKEMLTPASTLAKDYADEMFVSIEAVNEAAKLLLLEEGESNGL